MPTISIQSKEVKYLSERDWRLAHLINHIGDLHYTESETAFHNLAHSIIEQMLSMKAGRVIENRLWDLCGGELLPEKVSQLTAEEIKGCGMSLKKAQSLSNLAHYACEFDLESLDQLPDEEVSNLLQQLPGIGKWTADMFLLFYLGRQDILPVEDGALRQSFEWLYGAPLANKEVRQVVCSLWRPYSSVAVRYLYRALNNGLVKGYPSGDAVWSSTTDYQG